MKTLLLVLAAVALAACGPKPHPIFDGGVEDAGVDAGVDAGRQRGDEPPAGFSTALALPDSPGAMQKVGASASMALDQFGHPMVAGIFTDPNNDGLRIDDTLIFTRWNGVAKQYQAPLTVASIGEIDLTEPNRQVSLTRDSSTGTIGIAFVTDQHSVRIALSDDEGDHWSLETASLANPSGHALSNPVLVLAGGTTHFAYFEEQAQCSATGCGQVVYRRRAGKGTFTDSMSPAAAGSDVTLAQPISLAVDSTGAAGLAYFSGGAGTTGTVSLQFWRPGAASTQPIADTGGAAVTKPISVSLGFSATKPIAAYHLPSMALPTAQLWYGAGSDAAGSSFTVVQIPRNAAGVGLEGTQSYQSLAIDSVGKLAIGAYFAQTPAAQQCSGGPKLARSIDGATWVVCRPDTAGATGTFGFAGEWITAAFYKPGKVTLAFAYETNANPAVRGGVIVFRDP